MTVTMEVPGYKIEQQIGRGGMSTVYLALQESLNRYVALKVLSPVLAADKSFAERFFKEKKIIANLSHPNIVTVFDFGSYQDNHFLAMEYMAGGSLQDKIHQGLALEEALGIAKTLAAALHYAHSKGCVHRDIKALNILFREDGTPVLSDFGIAKFVDSSTNLTAPGMLVGSPHYMSPEQIRGQAVDVRSDLYSFGILFYQMLTGKVPYEADNLLALANQQVSAPLPTLPADLARFQPLIDKLLAKAPEQRLASADAFVQALNSIEAGTPVALGGPATSRSGSAKPQEKSRLPLIALAACLCLTFAAAASYIYLPEWYARGGAAVLSQTGAHAVPASAALDADRQRAERLLAQAYEAFAEGDLERSSALLEDSAGFAPDHPELPALREQVHSALEARSRDRQAARQRREQAEQRQRQAQLLLAQASQSQRAGNLEKSLRLIEDGLATVADHEGLLALRAAVQAALDERRRLRTATGETSQPHRPQTDRLFSAAVQAQRAGRSADSLALVERGLRIDPEHSGLRGLREEIARASLHAAHIDELLAAAQSQLERRLLTLPAGDNAYETYRHVLELDPDNRAASEGLRNIAGAYHKLADQALQRGASQTGLKYINRGLDIVPDHPGLLALQASLQGQVRTAAATRPKARPKHRSGTRNESAKKAPQRRTPAKPNAAGRRFGTF